MVFPSGDHDGIFFMYAGSEGYVPRVSLLGRQGDNLSPVIKDCTAYPVGEMSALRI
ncbi:MAG: hypothetical protein MZV63_27450 [Marinilabiliales bacterium]|nr:hypothetical protein [Marinilabiliales bacterium]